MGVTELAVRKGEGLLPELLEFGIKASVDRGTGRFIISEGANKLLKLPAAEAQRLVAANALTAGEIDILFPKDVAQKLKPFASPPGAGTDLAGFNKITEEFGGEEESSRDKLERLGPELESKYGIKENKEGVFMLVDLHDGQGKEYITLHGRAAYILNGFDFKGITPQELAEIHEYMRLAVDTGVSQSRNRGKLIDGVLEIVDSSAPAVAAKLYRQQGEIEKALPFEEKAKKKRLAQVATKKEDIINLANTKSREASGLERKADEYAFPIKTSVKEFSKARENYAEAHKKYTEAANLMEQAGDKAGARSYRKSADQTSPEALNKKLIARADNLEELGDRGSKEGGSGRHKDAGKNYDEAYEFAREAGAHDRAITLLKKAAEAYVGAGELDLACNRFISLAIEAETAGDSAKAAKLYSRAADLYTSSYSRFVEDTTLAPPGLHKLWEEYYSYGSNLRRRNRAGAPVAELVGYQKDMQGIQKDIEKLKANYPEFYKVPIEERTQRLAYLARALEAYSNAAEQYTAAKQMDSARYAAKKAAEICDLINLTIPTGGISDGDAKSIAAKFKFLYKREGIPVGDWLPLHTRLENVPQGQKPSLSLLQIISDYSQKMREIATPP
ncbi:Soluble NSF attachment protein, SNAP [Candidatus Gugararchaeum adminiculabundum]|nr:Soluble NSF attachment protein, SNAP [Candidatus Gugararchaeum adminiculabundum]